MLGDATHPMTPNVGQGACQAIEDAIVLARCLKDHRADPIRALRTYEQRRFPRTASVVRNAWRFGRIIHAQGGLVEALRNRIWRLTPSRLQERRLAALLRGDAPDLDA